jgi:hypothetical protein
MKAHGWVAINFVTVEPDLQDYGQTCTTSSTWPFAGLRGLLATQPFRAVAAGNPKALNRALTASPELRPHLFYDTAGGLMQIWIDAEPSPRGPRIPDLGESYGA